MIASFFQLLKLCKSHITITPRLTVLTVFVTLTVPAFTSTSEVQCNLPRYYADFFKIDDKRDRSCHNESSLVCFLKHLEMVDDIVIHLLKENNNRITVDCYGEWVNFSGLGAFFSERHVQLTDLAFRNCQFVGDTFKNAFFGLESSLKMINITCCSFVDTFVMPNLSNFSNLLSLTIMNNRYYPMDSDPGYSDYYIDFPVFIANGKKCLEMMSDSFKTFNYTMGECFCSTYLSLLNVSCFNTSETELFQTLQALAASTGLSIGSVKIYGYIINGKSGSAHAFLHWHPLLLAAALATNYKPIYDIRIRKCTWKPVDQRVVTFSDSYVRESLNISHLTLSACQEEDIRHKSIGDLLYFVPNTNYSTELEVDLGQNGISQGHILDDNMQGVHNITTLLLYGNIFTFIHSAILQPWSTNLRRISFRSNNIKMVESDTFESNTCLEHLDMAGNNAAVWSSAVFAGITHLRTLIIGSPNELGCFDVIKKGLGYLLDLTTLEIVHVPETTVIAPTALVGLGKLKTLRIVESSISKIPASVLKPLYSLSEFDAFKMGDAEHSAVMGPILSHLETLRVLTTDITQLVPVCAVLGKLPLLRLLKSSYEERNCLAGITERRKELFKWLQLRLNTGYIKIENIDRIACRYENRSFAQFLNETDFGNVVIEKIHAPKRKLFNMTAILPPLDVKPDPPNFEHSIMIFSVCTSLVCAFGFSIPCFMNRKKWLPRTTNFRTWLFGTPSVADWSLKDEMKVFDGKMRFDGFDQSHMTSSYCMKIFWKILIAIFAGLTAESLAKLIYQYTTGDTVINLDLANNVSFIQPPITLCMRVVQRDIEISERDLEAMLDPNPLCRENNSLPFQLVLFANIALNRIGEQMRAEVSLNSTTYNHSVFYNVNQFDSILRKRNITLRWLLQEQSSNLCHLMDIAAYRGKITTSGLFDQQLLMSPDNCSDLFRQPNYGLMWYDDTVTQSMCIRLPGLFSFSGNENVGSLSFKPLYPVSADDRIVVDLDPYLTSTGQNLGQPVFVPIAQRTKIFLALDNVYSMLKKRGKDILCYDECFRETRLPEIENDCKCRPLLWQEDSNPRLPECNVSHIALHCNTSLVNKVCDNSVPCTITKYSVSTTIIGPTAAAETVITFQIMNTIYSSFQEQTAMTFQTFLGSLGGNLGFWLQASFMGLIQLAFWIVRFCVVGTMQFVNRYMLKVLPKSPRDDTTTHFAML